MFLDPDRFPLSLRLCYPQVKSGAWTHHTLGLNIWKNKRILRQMKWRTNIIHYQSISITPICLLVRKRRGSFIKTKKKRFQNKMRSTEHKTEETHKWLKTLHWLQSSAKLKTFLCTETKLLLRYFSFRRHKNSLVHLNEESSLSVMQKKKKKVWTALPLLSRGFCMIDFILHILLTWRYSFLILYCFNLDTISLRPARFSGFRA